MASVMHYRAHTILETEEDQIAPPPRFPVQNLNEVLTHLGRRGGPDGPWRAGGAIR
jgi:hypothetical protein